MSFLGIFFYGRLIGPAGCAGLSVGNRGARMYGLGLLARDVIDQRLEVIMDVGDWIHVGPFKVKWLIVYDHLSIVRSITVGAVSLCVHLFAANYRREDPDLGRFRGFLSAFTFCRLLLVNAGNLVLFYVGWEGIGLCSFALISFWNDRPQAVKAGLKALFYNRVGDITFLRARSLIFKRTGTFNFSVIELVYPVRYEYKCNDGFMRAISCLFLVSVVAKSSQLALHLWLPDAREGPTPVSALIHAATRVTAGLYLRLRRNYVFALNQEILTMIAVLGAATALFGSLTAVVQFDIKRIIAFSTRSQLGYRRAAIGLNSYEMAFSHLIGHAYFKALLFIAAGIIVHNLNNEQDIRKMGGLFKLYPLIYRSVLIGNGSLCAFFGTSGFYTKDRIIDFAYAKTTVNLHRIFIMLYLAATITIRYTVRMRYIIFYRKSNIRLNNFYPENTHTWSYTLMAVLASLSIVSVSSGYFLSELRYPANLTFADSTLARGVGPEGLILTPERGEYEYFSGSKKAYYRRLPLLYPVWRFYHFLGKALYHGRFHRTPKVYTFYVQQGMFNSVRNHASIFWFKESLATFFVIRDKTVVERFTTLGTDLLIKALASKLSFRPKSIIKLAIACAVVITFLVQLI